MGKKVRSFSSTPAKKPKKFATNTPIVKQLKEKQVEIKRNQSLTPKKPLGLFDSDNDYEDDEIDGLSSDSNDEDSIQKAKNIGSTNKPAVENNDDSEDEDEDFEFKPVYEEVSEDDDWQNDDLDDEAFDLIKDQEEFEKTTDTHVILSDSEAGNMRNGTMNDNDSDEDDEEFKPVYEEVSEDDDWQNDNLDEEAFDLINDQEEHEKKKKPVDLNDEEDDESEDEDFEAEESLEFDEEMELGDDDSEEEQAKLDGEEDLEEMDEDALGKHEAELKKLMESDPKFAAFLKAEETDLLEFGGKLGEEEETEEDERIPITTEMIKSACKVFEDKKADRVAIRKCVQFTVKAFIACVKCVSPNGPNSPYVVTSDKDFDHIIKMTFSYLSSALLALLEPIEVKNEELIDGVDIGYKLKQHEHDPMPKFKHWKQCHYMIKQFCQSLNVFLMEIPSDNILKACLRAVMDNANLFVQFGKITKMLIKNLVRIWSKRSYESRCLAFVVLCKLVRFQPGLFVTIYKSCYIAYIGNTKGITLENLQIIGFMQKSFAELTLIEPSVAYEYAFVYIRQCAIHLRNATISKRKDLIKIIYNWQFVQCLYLWTSVASILNTTRAISQEGGRWLRDLIYPLTHVIMGVMKAFNSPRYIPLKIHCLRMLLKIQMNCQIYIPTMSLAAELLADLTKIDMKKPKKGKGNLKTVLEIQELIKFNVDMLEDGIYREKLATEIRTMLIEAAYVNRGSVAFTDIFIPVHQQIKKFLKEYKNGNILPLMKETFIAIQEHSTKVQELLRNYGIDLTTQKDPSEFAKMVDEKSDKLTKLRNILKQRLETVIIQRQRESKFKKFVKDEIKMNIDEDEGKTPKKNKKSKKPKMVNETETRRKKPMNDGKKNWKKFGWKKAKQMKAK